MKRLMVAAGCAMMAAAALAAPGARWTLERAQAWGKANPWYCGFNQIPANAINDVDIWQKGGFSPDVLRKEFKLASDLGFNCVRIFLQYKVYENDPEWFLNAFERYLQLADEAKLKVMPVLFDDCTFSPATDPELGKQTEPLPGWGMWGWVPSPGHTMVVDSRTHGRLEEYVKAVILRHRDDPRVFVWDLYNEPAFAMGAYSRYSLALVKKCFAWAREINPSQPLTACRWNNNRAINDVVLNESDIITFHCYEPAAGMRKVQKNMLRQGRPVICTEWLLRFNGCDIPNILPIHREAGVGSMLWGLVNGKAQTHLPNGRHTANFKGPWKHDLFHSDHTPYDVKDLEIIKKATGAK